MMSIHCEKEDKGQALRRPKRLVSRREALERSHHYEQTGGGEASHFLPTHHTPHTRSTGHGPATDSLEREADSRSPQNLAGCHPSIQRLASFGLRTAWPHGWAAGGWQSGLLRQAQNLVGDSASRVRIPHPRPEPLGRIELAFAPPRRFYT
jgi:hypothetical protein